MTETVVGTPTVRIARLGNEVVDIPYLAGMTVADALEAADVELLEGYTVRVENEPVPLDEELQEGQMIALVGQVRGG